MIFELQLIMTYLIGKRSHKENFVAGSKLSVDLIPSQISRDNVGEFFISIVEHVIEMVLIAQAVKVNYFKKPILVISNCTNISINLKFPPILFRMTFSLILFKQAIWRKTLKLQVFS